MVTGILKDKNLGISLAQAHSPLHINYKLSEKTFLCFGITNTDHALALQNHDSYLIVIFVEF